MLEDKYKKKSLTNCLYQKQWLYTLRMSKNTLVKLMMRILLYSLRNSYVNFVDSKLYGRENISINDAKDTTQSKELKRKL